MNSRTSRRLKIAALAFEVFLLAAGLALAVVGLFGYQMGIDQNPAMGRGRTLLAWVGGVLICTAALLPFLGRASRSARWQQYARALARISRAAAESPAAQVLGRASRLANAGLAVFLRASRLESADDRAAARFAALGVSIILAFNLFYITTGTFTTWHPYSAYYDRLANAFAAGQVALLEQPPAELLALANPYDYQARDGLGYLWDASLYRGQYHLYWGPVPALAALPVKAVLGPQAVVEDQHLLFAFCAGIAVLLALLLLRARRRFFPAAPSWSLLPLLLSGGLSIYLFWLINRPHVYETAIASAQFFLLAGMLAALYASEGGRRKNAWLAAAGFLWGAAVGSRLNLALAAGFFCLLICWQVFRAPGTRSQKWTRLAFLAAPLALWAAGLAGYNFARFGSVFETGHRYQLTGGALPADYRDVTSLAYVLPNLYGYLLRPLVTTGDGFPYIYAPFVRDYMFPWWVWLPQKYHYVEPVAGILTAMPAAWLAFLPLAGFARSAWRWLREQPLAPGAMMAPGWAWLGAYGGALCLFAPLTVFISISMRYLADVTPLTVILAAFGFWWAWAVLRSPAARTALAGTLVTLALVTVTFGLLANFVNGDHRFAELNPALYQAIAGWFP